MKHRRVGCTRFGAAIGLWIAFSLSSGASAQTLLEPNPKVEPKPQVSQQPGSVKPQSGLRSKSCSAFGVGFVQLPGTDTCVKIGGFIATEGAVNHAR
jgi:hypothetical protein